MSTTREPQEKFFLQDQAECPGCRRTVDVLSRNTEPGLLWSRHFVDPGRFLSFCNRSTKPFERPTPRKR